MKKILFLLVLISYLGFAQMEIDLRPIQLFYNVNTDNYPEFESFVRVTLNGEPITLNTGEIVIQEEHRSARPFEVSSPDADGFQNIKWYGSKSDYSMQFSATIFVTRNEITERENLRGFIDNPARLEITNPSLNPVKEIVFDPTPPGIYATTQIRIRGATDAMGGVQTPVFLNSVDFSDPRFTYKWLGSPQPGSTPPYDSIPPPRDLSAGTRYWINLYYTPDDYGFGYDVLKFTFEDHLNTYLPIYAGEFSIDPTSSIEVLSPKGGEFLVPCDEFLIEWTGHNNSQPVELFYTNDNGNTWNFIAEVIGSEYNWIVPQDVTDVGKIRVVQEFSNEDVYQLHSADDPSPVSRVDYDLDGQFIAVANQLGRIYQWDLRVPERPVVDKIFYLGTETSESNYNIFGLRYIEDDNIIVGTKEIALNGNIKDSLIFFNQAEERYRGIELPLNYDAKDIFVDTEAGKIYVVPDLGGRILIYEIDSDAEPSFIENDAPINDFKISPELNLLLFTTLDNKIKFYNTQNLQQTKEIYYEHLNVPDKLAISPDGRFLALSTYYENDDSEAKNNYLIELEDDRIIGVYKPSPTETVDIKFNSSSNAFIIASRFSKQINLFDLTVPDQKETIYTHLGNVIDFDMAPDGSSLVSLADTPDKVKFTRFSFSETDVSEGTFSIENPELSLGEIDLGESYIGHDVTVNLDNICISTLNLYVDSLRLAIGRNWQLNNQYNDTTLFAGECFDLSLNYNARDVGDIQDTLIIVSCQKDYKIVINGRGLARNITFFDAEYDFGKVCVNSTESSGNYQLLRNDDPVPLKIIALRFDSTPSSFSYDKAKVDTVLQPGEIYDLNLFFSPFEIRNYENQLLVNHSFEFEYNERFDLKGEGIGVFSELSHETLLFVPEIPQRTLTLTNTGAEPLSVDAVSVEPEGTFIASGDIPTVLGQNESVDIQVEWISGVQEQADLFIDANPCIILSKIPLRFYQGSSRLIIDDMEADPRDEVAIKINYEKTENGEYKGVRFIEGEFSINERIFLPQKVESQFGEGTITKNEVVDGIRNVGFRVEGDFTEDGLLAEVIGPAGLADVFTSDISFIREAPYFGENVTMSFDDGLMTLINVCGDRTVFREGSVVEILSVSPNPTETQGQISFTSTSDQELQINITDALGNILVSDTIKPNTNAINIFNFNLNNVSPGVYVISIGNEFSIDSELIHIVK